MADGAQPVRFPAAGAPAPRRFTRAEFDAMIEAGLFAEGEKVELLGGEIYSEMGEGHPHAAAVDMLFEALLAALPAGLIAFQRSRLDLPGDGEVYPDILVQVRGTRPADRNPSNTPLLVEASSTSLAFDLREKAERYAAAGYPEYWVLDVPARRLWVHREPTTDAAWGLVFKREGDETVSPLFAPEAAIAIPAVVMGADEAT